MKLVVSKVVSASSERVGMRSSSSLIGVLVCKISCDRKRTTYIVLMGHEPTSISVYIRSVSIGLLPSINCSEHLSLK